MQFVWIYLYLLRQRYYIYLFQYLFEEFQQNYAWYWVKVKKKRFLKTYCRKILTLVGLEKASLWWETDWVDHMYFQNSVTNTKQITISWKYPTEGKQLLLISATVTWVFQALECITKKSASTETHGFMILWGPSHVTSTGWQSWAPCSLVKCQFLKAEFHFHKTQFYPYHHYWGDWSKLSLSQTPAMHVQSGVCTSAWVMWFCCLLFSFSGMQWSSVSLLFGVEQLKGEEKSKKTSALFENQKQMFWGFWKRSNWYEASRVLGFEEVRRRQPEGRLHAGCRLK